MKSKFFFFQFVSFLGLLATREADKGGSELKLPALRGLVVGEGSLQHSVVPVTRIKKIK